MKSNTRKVKGNEGLVTTARGLFKWIPRNLKGAVKTEGKKLTNKQNKTKQNKNSSTHKAGSQLLPKQAMAGSDGNTPDHITHRYYEAPNKPLTNEYKDIRCLLM